MFLRCDDTRSTLNSSMMSTPDDVDNRMKLSVSTTDDVDKRTKLSVSTPDDVDKRIKHPEPRLFCRRECFKEWLL